MNKLKTESTKKHKKESTCFVTSTELVEGDIDDIYIPEETFKSVLHNQKVYEVFRGEMHEGGDSEGHFILYENALKYVKCVMKQHEVFPWKKEGKDTWKSGCSYITITEYNLDDCSRFKRFEEYKTRSTQGKLKEIKIDEKNDEKNFNGENLTPHDLHIYLEGTIKTIPPKDKINYARIDTSEQKKITMKDDIPIYNAPLFTVPKFLPDKLTCDIIVNIIIGPYLVNHPDLIDLNGFRVLGPDTGLEGVERDKDNKIIGTKRLIQYLPLI